MGIELPHFYIGSSYGGQQAWCSDFWMHEGGCAAITACDCSIYFELYKNRRGLCPFDVKNFDRDDYLKFAVDVMQPYLRPRWTGIDRLEIYIEGFQKFLRDRGESSIELLPFDGDRSVESARIVIQNQIDDGWLIPCLTLNHKNPRFRDYVWHWFLINGLDGDRVRLVSYGIGRWVELGDLWSTGFERKGGLIIFQAH